TITTSNLTTHPSNAAIRRSSTCRQVCPARKVAKKAPGGQPLRSLEGFAKLRLSRGGWIDVTAGGERGCARFGWLKQGGFCGASRDFVAKLPPRFEAKL